MRLTTPHRIPVRHTWLFTPLAAWVVGVAAASASALPCDTPVATAVSVQGAIEVRAATDSDWRPVAQDEQLCAGDVVRAGEHARADLLLLDQSLLRLRSRTELTLEADRGDEGSWVGLTRGAAHFLSRQGERRLQVETPYAVAGVRGTEFHVAVEDGRTEVTVLEGRVVAANEAGEISLAGGDAAVAEAGRAPVARVVADPREAVRWTLYYPPVVAPTGAVPRTEQDGARFYTGRAAERLAVGSVGEATDDLERALALDPDDVEALALQTVIAVAQSRQDDAEVACARARDAHPRSATARIACSYAEQARFDLHAARTSLEEAVSLAPEDALAWARLAELRSAFGDSRGALEAAERAASLDPGLGRAHTVLGFAHLVRLDTDAARAAFDRAVALDPADPTPHLGRGLARIRDGDLHGGAREIEVAVSLDPGDSLARSYLGKAYYEEKRDGLELRELEEAKKLDPDDPTPWFYEAIAKQTANRPVEALFSLEEAIERNDHRAVYRSRLLLDSDEASRSASLGRIYGDLGFESLALVEGWKSVNTDVSNFSAHRLLADSYASQPRHEIARVSELFQSQMLQPANLVPIQPRQGEGSLFLLGAQGPAGLSFTEFNPLFERNRAAFQANGLLGSDDTRSGEGIISGVYDRVSLSAGYSGYRTDGFRPNNEQDDRIANVFGQLQLSPDTSLQVEGRYRDLEAGDLELRFLRDDFSRFADEETETASVRGGLRHAFGPDTLVLISYAYQTRDTDFTDFFPDPAPDPFFGPFDLAVGLELEERGHDGQGQLIHREDLSRATRGWVENLQVVAGGGLVGVDVDELGTSELRNDFFPDSTRTTADPDVSHSSVYLYSQFATAGGVTLLGGVSGDFFHEEERIGHEDQANWKAGVTWTPTFSPDTTVRAAGFRTLRRTLVNQQTLEPTQVAGFNQFFDDPPGTDATRLGIALDQKLGKRVFAGAEFSGRDLEVPIFATDVTTGNSAVRRQDWDERLGRAYVYVTPFERLALRGEYQFERLERDEDGISAFGEVDTHRVPLGVEVLLPLGLSASFEATYQDQEGVFLRNATAAYEDGHRDFWLLGAGLSLRLPRRHGFVAVGVDDIQDRNEPYQATDVRNPTLRPGRFVYGTLTLAIP